MHVRKIWNKVMSCMQNVRGIILEEKELIFYKTYEKQLF